MNGEESKEKRFKVGGSKVGLKVMLGLFTTTAVVLAGFFYFKWQGLKNNSSEVTQQENLKEIEEMVEKIGKLVWLPEGEVPVLVRIEDKEKINKNQNFFEKTENGDVMLVYKEAKKAYLYRPSENKLINMAPVNIEGSDGVEEIREVEEKSEVFEVVIRSSAQATEISEDFSKALLAEFSNLRVLDLENTTNDGYDNSLLIVNSDEIGELADEIADKFGLLIVETLPEGEVFSESDLVVILGSDR